MADVVISGAAGRLGRRVLQQCLQADGLNVVGALVRPGSAVDGQHVGEGELGEKSLRYSSNPSELLIEGRVFIETALVPAALAHIALAAEQRVPTCIATTGFDSGQLRSVESYAHQIPVLVAPNLSLGVTVLLDVVRKASRALKDYHLEVFEMHHSRKRDAPSGTAWALASAASEARGRDVERDVILARGGEVGPRGQHELGMQSLRGGDIIGEHTVFLVGATERVELTHRAAHRDAFAVGAVAAAKYLAERQREVGLYSMRDVLGLE